MFVNYCYDIDKKLEWIYLYNYMSYTLLVGLHMVAERIENMKIDVAPMASTYEERIVNHGTGSSASQSQTSLAEVAKNELGLPGIKFICEPDEYILRRCVQITLHIYYDNSS